MTRLLAKLFRIDAARPNARDASQNGGAGASNAPTRLQPHQILDGCKKGNLQPHQRIERRKVHAVARSIREAKGLPPSRALQG